MNNILKNAIKEELNHWQAENKSQQLWAGDPALWTHSDESKWMGWLTVPVTESNEIPRIQALAKDIKTQGYRHVIVLGMGGSSLCPDVMAKTFGKIDDHPHLQVLDSTDPTQIRHLEESIDLKRTVFIVSSKSGSTLEPNIFKDYFYSRLQAVLGKPNVGDRFLAITDPGTKLETAAKEAHFKDLFYGVPSIGGRYSALSNFGMVPSGLMGVDIDAFLQAAEKMAQNCAASVAPKDNPGVLLGVMLGICAKQGKDKVTLVASPGIHALGAWLEQLLAESTGKRGKGLIPIDQEPLGQPDCYGHDRVFIYLRLEEAPDSQQDKAIAALEQSDHIVVRLNLPHKMQLGAELFRWEIATAVAGSVIGINPFDQPDVEGSKKLAAKILEQYQQTGEMPKPKRIYAGEGLQLFTDERNLREIEQKLVGEPNIAQYLRAHLNRVKPGDYVNFSAFLEMSDQHTDLLQQCRVLVRDKKKSATCLGFGPRFLHSTGQDYKGGPNTGVFLQITAEHDQDIQIPGSPYTFGGVIDAQAQADFEVLTERSRRVLRVHLGSDIGVGLQQLLASIKRALNL